jgi:hypothetical protein
VIAQIGGRQKRPDGIVELGLLCTLHICDLGEAHGKKAFGRRADANRGGAKAH